MLDRILQVMTEKHINKSQLAQMCGVTKSTIYTVLLNEENVQKAKLETIRPIADALGVSLDYLISGDAKLKDKNNFDATSGQRLHPLLAKYNKLSNAGRAKIDAYIDDLIASGNYFDDEICATVDIVDKGKKSLA